MTSRILVLGAGGRLGHAAARAFRDAGWRVTSLVRPGAAAHAFAGTQIREVDALDHVAVAQMTRFGQSDAPAVTRLAEEDWGRWSSRADRRRHSSR
jgi:uncharacterized protein YbjT (DUF2867 family)